MTEGNIWLSCSQLTCPDAGSPSLVQAIHVSGDFAARPCRAITLHSRQLPGVRHLLAHKYDHFFLSNLLDRLPVGRFCIIGIWMQLREAQSPATGLDNAAVLTLHGSYCQLVELSMAYMAKCRQRGRESAD